MRILKDSMIYIAGEVLAKAMPFMLIPYLSRRLGVSGYGELSYYQTYLALFVIIIGLSQEGAIARYFYFYGKRSINLVVRAGYIYTLTIGVTIFTICCLLQSKILAYIAIAAILQVLITVQLSVRQCQKQALSYVAIQMITAMMAALMTIVILEAYESELVLKRFLAILLGNGVAFSFAYYLYRKKENTQKSYSIRNYKPALAYILGFGFPLIFHHASFFIKGQVDRIFIYHQYSSTQLGVYAMGANLAAVVSVFILAINKATLPYYYEALKLKKISLQKIYQWVMFSFVLIILIAFMANIIPESWFLWMIGDEFIGVKYYFVIFMLSILLMIPYLLLVNYLFYYGKNKQIAACSIISTIIYLLSLLYLIQSDIKYIPFASILAAISILPILFWMTKRLGLQL